MLHNKSTVITVNKHKLKQRTNILYSIVFILLIISLLFALISTFEFIATLVLVIFNRLIIYLIIGY